MDKKDCVLKAAVSQVLLGLKYHLPARIMIEILIAMFASILEDLKEDASLSDSLLAEWSVDYLLMLDDQYPEEISKDFRNILAENLLGFLEGETVSESLQDKLTALREGTGTIKEKEEDLSLFENYLDGKDDALDS